MTAIHVLPLATADASLEMVAHAESLSPCGVGCLRDHAQSCSRDHRDRGHRGGEGDASGRPYRRRRGTTSAGVGQAVAGPRDYIIDRIGQFVDAGVDEIMSPRSVMPKPHSASTRRSSRPSTRGPNRDPHFRIVGSLVSPLDKNMGALILLHMGSWIDSTLNRRQTVASAKKGSDREPGSSLKRSRRGQMGQPGQGSGCPLSRFA